MIQPTTAYGGSSAPDAMRSAPGHLGKDEFLQLLVAQLRHQDPLNPLDAQDFAAQLAQFSSVEQLIRMNDMMELQAGATGLLLETLNGTAALNVLGRTVIVEGDAVSLTGSTGDSVSFDLSGSADATIRILDEAGETVLTLPVGRLAGGRHQLQLGEAAAQLPPGNYRFAVDTGEADADVTVRTHAVARVDGLRYSNGSPVFVIGGREVPVSSVLEIKP